MKTKTSKDFIKFLRKQKFQQIARKVGKQAVIINLMKGKYKKRKFEKSSCEKLIEKSKQFLFDKTCNPKAKKRERKYRQKHFYVSKDIK